ncbi:MAG: porin [Planctomycetota bacterium]
MSKTCEISLLAGAAVTLGAFGSANAAESQTYSTDEVRAVVADMLADAETRSSLLQSGGGVGYDESAGFFIEDSSGNNRLNIRGLSQTRYYLNFRDDEDTIGSDTSDDFELGFQQARTVLEFNGHVIDPSIFYNIRTQFDFDGGAAGLQWAYAGYRFDEGFQVKFGQFRTAFLREHNIRPEYQLVIERSPTNYFFDQGDSQGVELGYMAEDWRGFLAFTDGFNSANTDYTARKTIAGEYDPVTGDLISLGNLSDTGGESDFGITGRAEIRFNGTWDQFDDFTSMPGSEMGMMLGVAGHVEYTANDRTIGAGRSTYYAWTVDFSVEGDGWNLFAAGMGGHSDVDDVVVNNITNDTSGVKADDFGVVIQGGWFIPETDWELYGRYDVIFLDDSERALVDDTFQTLTFGTNWYWAGQAAKFSVDLSWFLDRANSLTRSPNSRLGFLSSDEDNQFTIRAQFQLLF